MEKNKVIGVVVVALIIGLGIGYNLRPDAYGYGKKPFGRNANNAKVGMYGEMGMHQMPNGEMMPNMMGGSVSGSGSMNMAQMMADMNAGLVGKTGDAFDKAFIDEMVVHHQGAVEMAKLVLATSKRPELIKLANDIITAQTKEINMMNGWSKAWFVK